MASLMLLRISVAFFAILFISSTSVNAQLSANFYAKSCPQLLSTVKAAVKKAVANEKRMGASLLRLHFHDCFVNGCDGSILLDDSSTLTGEKTAVPNLNSARGFDVIDNIKTQVEKVCSGVVSCADILTIAARDSVVELGGPSWTVPLGRRDSRTASKSGANNNIPPPTSSLSNLMSKFQAQGLSTKEMVALAGGHTIGQARCTSFRAHIYNDSNIVKTYATSLQAKCPRSGGDNNLSPLDLQTPTVFENNYYKNLQAQKGLLHSDQELFNGGSTDSQVKTYSSNQNAFFNDFAAAMVKMGNIKPLTGSSGEIRKNCRKPN
ncbi:peroxidase 4 [Cryptomeria japonica]|uniref:peroxidase 4 n=1 Tax=Cryptomeria japonica TaxID=3369 RepID=UPI0025ACE249|nr:peroxidase 4 [Cryptomeria japonica]